MAVVLDDSTKKGHIWVQCLLGKRSGDAEIGTRKQRGRNISSPHPGRYFTLEPEVFDAHFKVELFPLSPAVLRFDRRFVFGRTTFGEIAVNMTVG